MAILTQKSADNEKIDSAVSRFFKDFEVAKLLRICRAEKEKGFSALAIFQYLLCLVFSDRSMYMQLRTGSFKQDFRKNTVYRFLNSARTNWMRFTTVLSQRIVAGRLQKLTSASREDVFVIDDTLYSRIGYKKSELVSKVFDHVSIKYRKGFRLLTLSWSDGNTLIPINFSLLAGSKEENILGPVKACDGRSIAGKRRRMARTKATEVLVDLLKTAQEAGHTAKYVLFDTWFAMPRTICRIRRERGLDVIAMVKKSSRIDYRFNGQMLTVKEIFSACRHRPGKSKYLLSALVELVEKNDSGDPVYTKAKLVYVRNRSNKKDWIALICTNNTMPETEIIRVYGKRWDTEVFYKTCKSWLKLGSECHGLSYDALTAHVSLVFVRYMLLSLEQRNNKDERTIAELFYILCDELEDITFNKSMRIIVDAMLESMRSLFHLSEEQINTFTADFIGRLPEYLQKSIGYLKTAA